MVEYLGLFMPLRFIQTRKINARRQLHVLKIQNESFGYDNLQSFAICCTKVLLSTRTVYFDISQRKDTLLNEIIDLSQ